MVRVLRVCGKSHCAIESPAISRYLPRAEEEEEEEEAEEATIKLAGSFPNENSSPSRGPWVAMSPVISVLMTLSLSSSVTIEM